MRPPAKLAAFAVALAAAFGGGAALGGAVGPIDVGGDEPAHDTHDTADTAEPQAEPTEMPAGHRGHGTTGGAEGTGGTP